jgi:hypothetical protein
VADEIDRHVASVAAKTLEHFAHLSGEPGESVRRM